MGPGPGRDEDRGVEDREVEVGDREVEVGAGGEGGDRDTGGPEPGLSRRCPSDSSTEALTLNLTEVVKRQNPKSKKGFNQVRAPPPLGHPLRRLTGHVCVCVCVSVYACVCLCVSVSVRMGVACPRAVLGRVGERRGW